LPQVRTLGHSSWTDPIPGPPDSVVANLEAGDVLFFPALGFAIDQQEIPFFSPALVRAAKNISFDPRTGRVGGAADRLFQADALRGLMSRFSRIAAGFVERLLPGYAGRLETARASFRPVEIAGRSTSWRKDDTRLHVDSFPSTPVQGRRILRLFTNVNPDGKPRTWRVGEDFDSVARRFAERLRVPWRGGATFLRLLRLTKSLRSPYDSLMLQLHDRMKADADYQERSPQSRVDFPPRTTWIAFTDQVSHAAMAGQYQLEQTFLLPVGAMDDVQKSPLRVLERITGRKLT